MTKLLILLTLTILCCFTYANNIGTILHLTDPHYDTYYRVGSSATCKYAEKIGLRCCRDYDIGIPPYRKAGKWGDIDCDSPYDLIEYTVKWISNNIDNIDMIFWTGDSAGHHDLTQSFDLNMHAVDTVTDLFKQYLPKSKMIPVIGNHDTWPIDQLAPPIFHFTDVTEHLSHSWRSWLDNSMLNTFRYGGYYTTLLYPTLRLIVINCLYEDSNNYLDRWLPDPAKQYQWLEETMEQSQERNETIWLVGHIYPGASESTTKFTDTLLALVYKYKDIIKNQFFGHAHHDQFKLYKHDNTYYSHLYIAPSVMPDYHFPEFRIYTYNKTTFEVINYKQYYVNLTTLNAGLHENYKILYDAKSAYDIQDMSTQSWIKAFNSIKTNNNVFEAYCNRYNIGVTGRCNNKKGYLCDIEYINKTLNTKCY